MCVYVWVGSIWGDYGFNHRYIKFYVSLHCFKNKHKPTHANNKKKSFVYMLLGRSNKTWKKTHQFDAKHFTQTHQNSFNTQIFVIVEIFWFFTNKKIFFPKESNVQCSTASSSSTYFYLFHSVCVSFFSVCSAIGCFFF